MAGIVRSGIILNQIRRRIIQPKVLNSLNTTRCITTSKKNSEVGVPSITDLAKTDKDFSKPETETWLSEGFDVENKEYDRSVSSLTFFGTVTMCLVVACFYFAYIPDFSLRQWASREAYLEVRRREELGLPHVDPNYADPSTVNLPSEEELEGVEIIL